MQNASLEIAWCKVVLDPRTIAGNVVSPLPKHVLSYFFSAVAAMIVVGPREVSSTLKYVRAIVRARATSQTV